MEAVAVDELAASTSPVLSRVTSHCCRVSSHFVQTTRVKSNLFLLRLESSDLLKFFQHWY